MLKKTVKFYNGVEIPILGFGTWQIPNDIASRAVKDAIDVGYIHIDTAAAYQNEVGVGEGIKHELEYDDDENVRVSIAYAWSNESGSWEKMVKKLLIMIRMVIVNW